MMQLIDKNGNFVNSHFRDNGAIVVKNDAEYTKIVSFKNKIDSMQNEISALNILVNKLIQTMDLK